MINKKIFSEKEIIPILILSKVFSILIVKYTGDTTSNIYSTIFNLLITNSIFLVLLLLLFKINRDKNINIFSAMSLKSHTLTNINLVILLLLGITAFSFYFNNFLDFTTNAIYTKVDFLPLSILFFLIITYAMYSGIQALSKTSTIVLILFFALLIMLFLLTVRDFDINNILNEEFIIDIEPKNIAMNFLDTFEFILLLYLLKYYKNGKKSYKLYVNFVIVSLAISIFIILISTLSVGEFLKGSNYPVFILSIVTNISFLQRLDGIFIIVWVLIAFVKIAVIAFLLKDTIDILLKKIKNKFTFLKMFLLFIFVIASRFNLGLLQFSYGILFAYVIIFSAISIAFKKKVKYEQD